MAENLFITNRKQQKIAVLLEKKTPQKGLVRAKPESATLRRVKLGEFR